MKSLPINRKKLKELYRLSRHHNVNILEINPHIDSNSKNPFDKLSTELNKEVQELFSISERKEIDELISYFPRHLQGLVTRNLGENYNLEILSSSYLIYELLQFKFSFKDIVNQDLSKSEILIVYPELIDLFDDDQLIQIDNRFQFAFDGLIYKEHLLYFHQFFRKGYSGNHNVDFLYNFGKYYFKSQEQNKFRIALDHSRIIDKEYYQRTFEFDTWPGCHFEKEKIDNTDNLGLTVVKRNEFYPFDLMNTLSRAEFLWTLKNNIKTFQAEELSTLTNKYDHFYLNRYVHSERNIDEHVLRHFDGAVKIYLEQDYKNRLQVDLKGESKSHRKVKLFRIDGDIDLKAWIDLISYFYKGNEMVIEYFDPEQYNTQYKEVIEAIKLSKEEEKAGNK